MKFTSKVRITTAIAGIGALVALTACSPGAEADAPTDAPEGGVIVVPGASEEGNAYMNELYDKAIADGQDQLVLYGPAPSTNRAMNDVFMARFPGIKIVPQDQADAQTLTKLDTEAASGNHIGDIYVGGESPQAAAKPDLCTPADVRTAPEGFEVPTDFDGRLTYYALRMFGFVYNTDMVKAADAPKDWHDLLDPKWKSNFTMGDPSVPGALRVILTQMMVPESEDEWGKPFMEELAAQDPQFSQSESTVSADVAGGRFPIGIGVFQGYYEAQKEKGAPIEFIFPLDDGGNFMARSAMCLINGAKNADVAQLYINWMYSPEGQETLALKDRSYGWTPDAPGPEGFPSMDQLQRLPFANPDPEFNKPYYAFITETFKK